MKFRIFAKAVVGNNGKIKISRVKLWKKTTSWNFIIFAKSQEKSFKSAFLTSDAKFYISFQKIVHLYYNDYFKIWYGTHPQQSS